MRPQIELWEWDLLREVVRSFRDADPDELEVSLVGTLVDLKSRPPPGVRNWNSYLRAALCNKARNWFRDRRRRERKSTPIVAPGEEPPGGRFVSEDSLSVRENDELRVALKEVFQELDPDLRRLWIALDEENGSRVAVGRRLGLHPNTVRKRIGKIRQALQEHGFSVPDFEISPIVMTPLPPSAKRRLLAMERRRRSAIRLLASGYFQTEVSRRLGVARQTVNKWAKRHGQAGGRGWKAARTGPRPRMSATQRRRLLQLLRRGPPTLGAVKSRWTSTRVTRLIKNEFDVIYHPGHVWKLLRKLGWHRTPD